MNQRLKTILERIEDVLCILFAIIMILCGLYNFYLLFTDTTERFFHFFAGFALCMVGVNLIRNQLEN